MNEAPTSCQASGVLVATRTTRRKFSPRSTATAAQLARIIDALRSGPKTTDDLRKLGIYQTSARIFGLRAAGYNIETTLFDGYSSDGYSHARMARYTLVEEAVHVVDTEPMEHVASHSAVVQGDSA